jgi:hypothetical protein
MLTEEDFIPSYNKRDSEVVYEEEELGSPITKEDDEKERE